MRLTLTRNRLKRLPIQNKSARSKRVANRIITKGVFAKELTQPRVQRTAREQLPGSHIACHPPVRSTGVSVGVGPPPVLGSVTVEGVDVDVGSGVTVGFGVLVDGGSMTCTVAVGSGVDVGLGLGLGVDVAVGSTVTLAVGVRVGLGVAVGSEASGVTGSAFGGGASLVSNFGREILKPSMVKGQWTS